MSQGYNSSGPNRILDEFAKLMTDAAGLAQGAKDEAETALRGQAEKFLSNMDLVQRDEFEAVRDMASKARLENEALRAELEELRALLQKPTAKAASKSGSKKAADKN